ncbi:hypothetical protein PSTG_06597 [Puccinia striiformis f. sp. tritici PST-78]|uniref:Uncharacterized protein n=1 Tax=Puccinia striiformis f. sp. tritici PST-78 TaxID=1165861 RepID=A0A0L0VLU0_9BASI|nr:hypothetical protein PSTG_06597 [Puccinia striiformis f. sp. tritici PST-78]
MTTRESNKDPLLPLSDPEAIFWAANAERCRRIAAHAVETAINVPLPSTPTLQATTLPSRAVTPVPSVPTTSASFNELPSPFLQRHTMSNLTDSSQPSKDDMSMTDCLEAMMAIQQTTVLQFQASQAQALADREATSARMARLEEIAINTSIKTEPVDSCSSTFFTTTDVDHSDDKIRVVGGLLKEPNLLRFYANESTKYTGKPWEEFKVRLMIVAIPSDWETGIRKQVKYLKMQDSENFIEFSTRAGTLQSLLNFDTANSYGDFELAECVTFGLPREIQVKISDFRLLRQKLFDYSDFEDCVAGYFEYLPKRHNGEPGACRGQIDKKYTDIPASFVTPPKPTDYKPPKPWGPSPSNAGKATHPPAGQPPYRSSTVAGVEELPNQFTYDLAAVDAVQAVGLELPKDKDDSTLYPRLKAIFWAANAERCRRIAAHAVETAINIPLPSSPTLQATTLPSRAVTPVPSVPTTSASFNELPSPFLKRHTMSNPTDSSQPSKDDMSMTDCLEAMMAIQQTTVLQFQASQAQALADREATSARMARLEEIAINTSIKTEPGTGPAKPLGNRVDFQKFRFADGPSFTVDSCSSTFFTTTDVDHSDDKIRVVGGLLKEPNLLRFYANESTKYTGKPWEEFKVRLMIVAIPSDWETGIRKQVKYLKMQDSENFIEFSTRAGTLQSLLNFDTANSYGDFELAECVTFGLPREIQVKISDFRLLRQKLFDYSDFEDCVAGYFEYLPKRHNGEPGACRGQIDKKYTDIPASFVTPPKPTDYKPPKPWGPSPSNAGKATHPPAGQPPYRSSTVAGVEELPNHFPYDSAAVDAV